MVSLILVRHAKSSWDLPVQDKERPLIEIGRKNIVKVALKALPLLPQQYTIWSSTAQRAMQTALLFCETNAISVDKIIFKDSLYTFDDRQLEKEIKKCDASIKNLIIFGHNVAITNFVNKFGDSFIANVPTAGFVMIKFEQNTWENMNNKGKITTTIFPKEI
jgi:phosphohistidine phosphatase